MNLKESLAEALRNAKHNDDVPALLAEVATKFGAKEELETEEEGEPMKKTKEE